jgi:hypothetical protein
MRKFSIIVILLSIAHTVISQKKLPDFGDIDPSEIELKSCPFEPEANAVKLFDTQEIEFDFSYSGARLKTERRVRIKIFNEKGYKHANIKIPYYSKRGVAKIKQLHAIIYNFDASGKVIKQELTKKDFFKEKSVENVGMVNFTFPGLKPGSIIEYTYTQIENNILQISPWFIQGEIPVLYSFTSIETPAESRIEKKIWGTDTIVEKTQLIRTESYRRTLLYKENVISFEQEPLMSSYKDNLMKVSFLLIPMNRSFSSMVRTPAFIWNFAGSNLMSEASFGGQIKKTIPGTEKLIDSAKAISSVRDRIIFLYHAVKNRLPEKTEQTLYPDDVIEAWNSKVGNTAEINLILLNLLRKAEVISYPLLVSTRDNGKVNTQFPSVGQLNGVDVVAVDSNTVYIMDASLKFQSSQNPPLNVLNRIAFLLDESEMKWIMVDDNRPLLKQVTQIQSELKKDGTLEGNMFSWNYDYAKSYMLDSTIDDDNENHFDKKPQGLKILSVTSENADDDSKPLQQTAQFTYELQQTGDFLFINPQFFSSKKENPFIKDNRKTDIDFGCKQQFNIRFSMSIPENFQLDFIPKSILVRAPDSSFMFKRNVFADNSSIAIHQTFEINKTDFEKEQYPGLQEFFRHVYTLMNEDIVLKRKK